jgi:hypothetical protein
MENDMPDDFDFLRSLRPDLEPDAAVTERHRLQLQRRMVISVAALPVDTGDVAYTEQPLPVRPIRGTPRRWSLALVGAAAAVVMVAGGLFLVARGERPDDKAGEVRSTAPLTCGDDIPATIEVTGATGGPLVGPGPGSDPADAGQYVVHWLRDGGMVELRWPSPPLGDYDDGSGWTSAVVPSETFGSKLMGPQGEVTEDEEDDLPPDAELSVLHTGKKFYPLGSEVATKVPILDGSGNVVGEGTATEMGGDPDLMVGIDGQPAPEEGCEIVEFRTIGPAGKVRSAFDLSDLSRDAYVGSLIDVRETVGEEPKEPYSCPREPIPGTETNNVPPAQDPLPLPVDVLKRAVGQVSADYADGWTEWLEPDGTYTYTKAEGDGSRGLFFVITVVPSGDGWVSEGLVLGRC